MVNSLIRSRPTFAEWGEGLPPAKDGRPISSHFSDVTCPNSLKTSHSRLNLLDGISMFSETNFVCLLYFLPDCPGGNVFVVSIYPNRCPPIITIQRLPDDIRPARARPPNLAATSSSPGYRHCYTG